MAKKEMTFMQYLWEVYAPFITFCLIFAGGVLLSVILSIVPYELAIMIVLAITILGLALLLPTEYSNYKKEGGMK